MEPREAQLKRHDTLQKMIGFTNPPDARTTIALHDHGANALSTDKNSQLGVGIP